MEPNDSTQVEQDIHDIKVVLGHLLKTLTFNEDKASDVLVLHAINRLGL